MAQSTSTEADEDESSAAASKDALYERATELKIKGRRKMNRDDLEAAVAAAEKELAATAPPADPVLPPDEAAARAAASAAEGDGPPKEATPEQARKIFAAGTEQLEGLAADSALAPHLKLLVVQELGRRTEKVRAETLHQRALGPMERFKVTRGGRYITRDGFPTELPTGSVITALTHDLEHVRKQNIQFETARAVGVAIDQLGNQVTEVQ